MKNSNKMTAGLIKLMSSLKNKKKRDEYGLFLAEGFKLCNELLNSDYNPKFLIIKKETNQAILNLAEKFEQKKVPVYLTDEKTLIRISNTVTPQEILAVVHFKADEALPLESFIALDQISDPGNIGTIIRTAEWFGFKQVIMSESCTDKYNPKLIRATMGSIFRMNIITGINFEKSLKSIFPRHELIGASLESKNNIETLIVKGKFGLIFGSESHGISKNLKEILDNEFIIPGKGAESLNVAVSAGISMYTLNRKVKYSTTN